MDKKKQKSEQFYWIDNLEVLTDTTIVQFLKKLKDINAKDSTGKTLLHHAISNYQSFLKPILDQKPDLYIQTRDGFTPLALALICDKTPVNIIKDLIKVGVDVNVGGASGFPLMFCIGYTSQYFQLLVDNGADVFATGPNHENCLMIACQYSQASMVKKLLELGFDVNTQDDYGNTALIYAATKANLSVLQFLLKQKPNLYLKNISEETALDAAQDNEDTEVKKALIAYYETTQLNSKDEIKQLNNLKVKIF